MPRRGLPPGPAALAFAALLAGCREGSTPAASLSFTPAAVRLAYPQSAAVKLSWRPARELDRLHGKPLVFVHLLDRAEGTSTVLRTFDHALPQAWAAGKPQDYELDLYQSALAEPLPPGRYVLSLGLYDDSWGYRWPLQTGGPEAARREYRVATVEVSGADPSAPKFSFSAGWRETEAVPTRQVLAHRCLSGPASLLIGEIRAAGTLRLLWTIPGQPRIAFASTCEEGRRETLAIGQTWVSVRVPADMAGGRCELRVEPEQPPAGAAMAPAPAACLEVLAWRPDARAATGDKP